jgi:hypothetical protein
MACAAQPAPCPGPGLRIKTAFEAGLVVQEAEVDTGAVGGLRNRGADTGFVGSSRG